VPLEIQGCVLPVWRSLINISKEPYCRGCCSHLNISQGMLKILFYLVSYYKRLKTNAQNWMYFDWQGRSHILESLEAQSSKAIYGPFCLKNWEGSTIYYLLLFFPKSGKTRAPLALKRPWMGINQAELCMKIVQKILVKKIFTFSTYLVFIYLLFVIPNHRYIKLKSTCCAVSF